MAVRKTVQIGDPVLRETAKVVENVETTDIRQIIGDLKDTMRKESLVGMAAPQIGESVRIFVTEIRETEYRSKDKTTPFTAYINPEIVHVSHETELDYEGCGSIVNGGLFGKVERPKEVTLKYIDTEGVSQETSTTGLLARVIQHELDHLNGVMFTDLCDPITLVSREYYLNNLTKG